MANRINKTPSTYNLKKLTSIDRLLYDSFFYDLVRNFTARWCYSPILYHSNGFLKTCFPKMHHLIRSLI